MPDQPDPDRPAPFDVVLLPHGRYLNQRDNPDFDADAEAGAIAELFEQLGGETQTWDVPPKSRDLSATVRRLGEWAARPQSRSSVLVWLGHGRSNDDDAWLAVRGSDGKNEDEEFDPATLARHIRKEHRRRRDPSDWTVVVIEACSAGAFVGHLSAALDPKRADSGILLIGSGENQGDGYLARFRHALEGALANYPPNHTHIRLNDLATRIDDRLKPGKVRPLSLAGSRPIVRAARLPTVKTSVEAYGELARVVDSLPEHERLHFARKGMAADLGEVAWHFVGRDQERSRIAAWLADCDHGLLVVTGPAGSGKSAILGNLLLHSHPEVAEVLSRAGFPSGSWPEGNTPPAIDVSIHLAGATAHDVTTSLASATGVSLSPAAEDQRWDHLVAALRCAVNRRRFTVLADALDEAREPVPVAAMLNELGTVPGVRIVVGTRMPTSGAIELPDSHLPNVLQQLGRGREHVTVLDVEPDTGALATFVRQRLSGAGHADEAVERAVDLITGTDPVTGAEQTFLYASLAVHEILANPNLLTITREDELAGLLGSGHGGVFAAAVDRLTRNLPVSQPALEALAFAQGRGLPMADRTWATAATALYAQPVIDDHLQRVLTAAAPYILLDVEDGQSVYRLAHDTFRDFFLPAADSTEPGLTSSRARLAMALLHTPWTEGPVLNPYLVRHLSGHIAAAGMEGWRSLAERLDILDRLDPHAVASDAMRGGGPLDLPDAIVGTIATAHLTDGAAAADRRGLRELGMVRTIGSLSPSAGRPADDQVGTWGLRWARTRRHPLHLTLAGHPGPVRAMASFSAGDGTWLATGSDDGLVRIWDPATGRLVGHAPVVHTGPVLALAAIDDPAGGLIASAGRDNTVRVWHSATGRRIGRDIDTDEPITVLCLFADADQSIMLAGGSWSGGIRVWDITAGGEPIPNRTEHHNGAVHALTTSTLAHGDTVLVSAGQDGMVRLWHHRDVSNRLSWQCPIPVRAVSVFSGPDGSRRVATAGNDEAIRIWDPVTGQPIGNPLTGHQQRVRALTVLTGPGGERMLASASDDGTVRIWDPETSGAFSGPLTGHNGPATSIVPVTDQHCRVRVAAGGDDRTVRVWDPFVGVSGEHPRTLQGDRLTLASLSGANRALLATAGEDGAVRVWDAVTGRPEGEPWIVADRPVRVLGAIPAAHGTWRLMASADTAVHVWDPVTGTAGPTFTENTKRVRAATAFVDPAGRTLLAIGGHDRTVFVWNPDTGALVGEPFVAHDACIRAIAAFTSLDGDSLLALGGDGTEVQVWNPITGRPAGDPLCGHSGSIRALAVFAGPHGEVLLAGAGGPGTVTTWNLTTRAKAGPTLAGHTDWITSLTVFRQGTRDLLVTGGYDHTVRIWDPGDSRPLHVLPLGQRVLAVVPLADDLAVATTDGVLVLRWKQSWPVEAAR